MRRLRFNRIAVVFAGTLLSSFAVAQNAAERSEAARANAAVQQQLLLQQEAQQRADNLKSPSIRLDRPVAGEQLPFPVESSCSHIREFSLTVPESLPEAVRTAGAASLPQDPFAFAQQWLENFRGRCLGEQGVELLARRLNEVIINRGYITTRVVVAAGQDLASGRLLLHLIPGTIHAIRLDGTDTGPSWRSAFPTRPGDVLALPALEQGLEQMKQVSSQDVDIQLVPAQSLGQSDVVVLVRSQKPWRLTAYMDNGGYRDTGRIQQALNLGVDNPLGLNDQLNLGISHASGRRGGGLNGWNMSYAVPYGYWSTAFSAYGNSYRQRVVGTTASFTASGESQGAEWRINRVLSRAQNHVLGAFLKLGKRQGRGFIEDTEIPVQSRNNTYIEAGLSNRSYLHGMQLDMDLAHRQGVPWLGARDAPPGFPQTYLYRMQILNASVKMPFAVAGQGALYTSSLQVRYTPDALFFIDSLAIGNRWTVRGFDGESALRGEKGGYWRNELETALPGTAQTVYAGLDYGRVGGWSTRGLSGKALAGMVIGARGGWTGGRFGTVSFNLFVGTPLYKPEGFQAARLAPGFELAYQY